MGVDGRVRPVGGVVDTVGGLLWGQKPSSGQAGQGGGQPHPERFSLVLKDHRKQGGGPWLWAFIAVYHQGGGDPLGVPGARCVVDLADRPARSQEQGGKKGAGLLLHPWMQTTLSGPLVGTNPSP